MRRKPKFSPINHVDDLGFAPKTWEPLALAQIQRVAPPRFIILTSMQPLYARNPKFATLTKQKVNGFVTLMNIYFPDTTIEFLMSDTLYLDNHSQPKDIATQQLNERKEEWTKLLGVPVDKLSSTNPSFPATYTLDPAFRDQFAQTNPPESKPILLSSWSQYQTEELSEFMLKTRNALSKILTSQNPDEILLDDEKLFHADHLGFVKEKLESIITVDIGCNATDTSQFRSFIGTFSLAAIHHLKKLHTITIPMCNADDSNDKRTAVKKKIFQKAPEKGRLTDFASSFSLLIHEFCYFAEMLVDTPRKNNILDGRPLHIYYASGIPYAPIYHPIYQLNYFLEAMGLHSRGFLACAEFPLFPLQLNNNEHPSSSNRGNTMKHGKPQADIVPITGAKPPEQKQLPNGSLTDLPSSRQSPSNSTEHRKSGSGDDSGGEEVPSSSSSSSSSSNENMMFKSDPVDQSVTALKKKRLESYLLKHAEEQALGDDGEFYAQSLLDVMAQNRKESKSNPPVGKTLLLSKNTAANPIQAQAETLQQQQIGKKDSLTTS